MVRNPALGEVVGADPLVAHTGAHLAAAHTGHLTVQPLLLLLIELGGQHPHTFLPVLELAALLLAGHHNSRGLVDQTDGGAGFVDVLAAGAGGPIDLHLNVCGVELYIHLFHLRQHRNGGSGGVDPAAGLGFRHPLNPVHTGFVFHSGIGPPAADNKVRLLDAPQLGFAVVHQLNAPALGGGVHGVHPEKAVGKQGAFLTAHTAPDFHDDVFFVVGILGQQQNLQLPVKPLFFLSGVLVGLLAQLLHFRIRHQLLGILHFLNGPVVGVIALHNGFQVVFLPQQPGSLLGITVKIRLFRFDAELLISARHGLKL